MYNTDRRLEGTHKMKRNKVDESVSLLFRILLWHNVLLFIVTTVCSPGRFDAHKKKKIDDQKNVNKK